MSVEAFVTGVGARACSGLTALQVTMMTRARKSFPRASHLRDREGDSIGMCRLPSIGDQVHGFRRFVSLGAPALAQAAQPWMSARIARREPIDALPLVLALPKTTRPGYDPDLTTRLLDQLIERSGIELDRQRSLLVHRCRAGGVAAFATACELIERGADAVLVGGIDSHYDPEVLEWLDRELRLHGSSTENGFIPGEGAAFLMLTSRRGAASVPRFARIAGIGLAREPHPYGDAEPNRAEGMSAAIRAATTSAFGDVERPIEWALTDVTNERHRVQEWSMAASRRYRSFIPDLPHEQPLLELGDLGAASAAMLATIACVRWQTQCGRGDVAIVAAHSDDEERGALVLTQERAS